MAVAVRRTLAGWAGDIANRAQLLMAAKTAVAASIAWVLAPLVPFAADEYSYYAPLGVVISMYPTLIRSLRSGLQAVVGLACGIALGFGGLAVDGPRWLTIALVLGVGTMLSGLRVLGIGRSWVPITALFVLLIGGGHGAETYSMSYLVDMGFGVIVGVAVNLIVFPPLYLKKASDRLNDLRDLVATDLRGMADAVEAHRDDDPRDVLEHLEKTAANVREEVRQATESRKVNPRGRSRGGLDDENYRRLRALQRTVFYVRDLADVLATLRDDETGESMTENARHDLVRALRNVGDLVAAPNESVAARVRLADADAALEAAMHSFDDHSEGPPSAAAVKLTVTVCLRRIIEASRPFVSEPPR
ncbi:FUSC family protein [Microbacterium sp. STN6]|uniref:FUSC family protein n=1 Tax=Microbacterium sp. STN6 TaxID=2995588 RepID=UPI002260D911|nr:FUSC family protein [Microbacterium sp. STN6]MCX7522913.1 FUSC family protein [Microbacterium sp. STN6]